MDIREQLIDKIETKRAIVVIVGLGYVGLLLALCFVEKGYRVIGLDVKSVKTDALRKGNSYINHIPSVRIKNAVATGLFDATTDFTCSKLCDVILIAVPTPLSKNREPDLSFVLNTCEALVPNIRGGQLMVLESTT